MIYQPIVDLCRGTLIGFEALVRWQRGETLVAAQEIISVAEETGLIVPDRRMGPARVAAADARVGRERAVGRQARSARQRLAAATADPNVIERLREIIDAGGVDSRRLHLE